MPKKVMSAARRPLSTIAAWNTIHSASYQTAANYQSEGTLMRDTNRGFGEELSESPPIFTAMGRGLPRTFERGRHQGLAANLDKAPKLHFDLSKKPSLNLMRNL